MYQNCTCIRQDKGRNVLVGQRTIYNEQRQYKIDVLNKSMKSHLNEKAW